MFRVILVSIIFISFLNAKSCIECHQKEGEKCQNSIHYTLKKAINITRETWGIKDSNVTVDTLPLPKSRVASPLDLVDDMLRRKCLKCHIDTKKSDGCLSCHNRHPKDKKFFKAKTTMSKCLKCHNKEYIGTDYIGLFPKDFEKSYRAPLTKKGYFPKRKYGIDYHHLSEDGHYKAGLKCADCHKYKDMVGKQRVSCKDCHKQPSKKNHPKYHSRISCIACHSSWGINSYELSLLRDDTAEYKQWKRLTLQEDSYLENFLNRALKSKRVIKPVMPDWISGKIKDGIWYMGYRYRRWEDFYLANNLKTNKIELYRPLYQYRVSFRDKNGKVILDDVGSIDGKKMEIWLPYYPHTIGKYAKTCEMCHNNPLLFNQKRDGSVRDLKLPINLYKATKLTKEQLKRMKSKRYKKIRAKLLY